METCTLTMVIIGAATCTGWLFKLVDLIEGPSKR